ncbi:MULTISPECIES: tetratricopeptide repeat protein [unclassified Lysobacter]|uniref:tetratricopeptide repeat protein n=1 Tax=unclassified Lysobacter TaxID=2635362 RepID=UPI0006FC0A39|nr:MULTISPECIES: tetratricopeptide repeat protein [unclassified Lysobacter]KQZ55934.1 hypothetical protein ASD53_13900 [Lysobacter sp. Root559]KRA73043.1 hypothetical protein ASD78_15730 [Lysobacter sp. Root667]KRC31997.1 hypothetical protein ASE10_15620 [Lysobacter sp. Root76]KRD67461.1 hypothetical protein ASE45_11795 [Lysobacter sp. Root96]
MKIRTAAVAGVLFVSGIAVGYAAQKVAKPAYHGQPKQEAAKALLQTARTLAGKGSWERIAVGRVYYLGGLKADGQAIFDEVLAGKAEDTDFYRIARVYREAGEWDKAKAMFDRYLKDTDDDQTKLAEIGAYYLMQGDRATAERMFDQSFKTKPELWAAVAAAGGYLDVAPQE